MQETQDVLDDILAERRRQNNKWGEQNHPDGTGPGFSKSCRWSYHEQIQRNRTDRMAETGHLGWSDILAEEVAEAFHENDEVRLREELVQVAAVAVSWIECMDRRQA